MFSKYHSLSFPQWPMKNEILIQPDETFRCSVEVRKNTIFKSSNLCYSGITYGFLLFFKSTERYNITEKDGNINT